MNTKTYLNVRPDVIASLDRYAERGILPGGFLTAVLENNLMEAVGRADMQNAVTLKDICTYVYNEMPAQCHGSPAKVDAWLRRFEKSEET